MIQIQLSSYNITAIYVTSNTSIELTTNTGSLFCGTKLRSRNFFLFLGSKMYQPVMISTFCFYFRFAKQNRSISFFIHQSLQMINNSEQEPSPLWVSLLQTCAGPLIHLTLVSFVLACFVAVVIVIFVFWGFFSPFLFCVYICLFFCLFLQFVLLLCCYICLF